MLSRGSARNHRNETKEAFVSIQQQLAGGTKSSAGAAALSDDETSPKWCVPLPIKTFAELDLLEHQLVEDEEMQEKMVCPIYIVILYDKMYTMH